MALEGDLKEFEVAEVMQFLLLHQGTGVLTLISKGDKAQISFELGMIIGAIIGKKGAELPLEEYILRSGKVDKETLENMKSQAEKLNIPIDELFMREGLLTRQEIEEIIHFKIQEIIDEVLLWKEGKYQFIPHEALYSKSRIKISIDPNSLLMEGMRRIDEWPRIQSQLPDPTITFKKKAKPEIPLKMGRDERVILELIDENITLKGLIEKGGLGKYRTYQAVYNLLELGAIVKKGEKKVVEKKGGRKKIKLPVNAFSIFFLIVFIGINLYFISRWKKVPPIREKKNTGEITRINKIIKIIDKIP